MEKIQLAVRAEEVLAGDEIYNPAAYHPAASWVRVESIARRKGYVSLNTSYFSASKHPLEAVCVRRAMQKDTEK